MCSVCARALQWSLLGKICQRIKLCAVQRDAPCLCDTFKCLSHKIFWSLTRENNLQNSNILHMYNNSAFLLLSLVTTKLKMSACGRWPAEAQESWSGGGLHSCFHSHQGKDKLLHQNSFWNRRVNIVQWGWSCAFQQP